MNSLSCDTMRDLIGALLVATTVLVLTLLIYFNVIISLADVGFLLHALISPPEEAL